MKCKYFTIRTRQYQKYKFCRLKKQVILNECENCLFKEYKENKAINKVSKKRICVSKETYKKVYERDNGRCRLCGNIKNIQLHHIYFRSERKDLIDEPTNCIMLCIDCHRLVHSNKHKWQTMLLKMVKNK